MLILFGSYFFILGAIFGSFLSCLAWRLYREESAWPPSRCDACGRKLQWFENVPIIGFLLLKGRCASCHKKISWQYVAAEIFGGLLFSLAFFWFFKDPAYFYNILPSGKEWWQFALELFSLSVLFFVLIYDGRYYLVSVPITIGACLILFLLQLFLGVNWLLLIITAFIGGGFFLLQYLITKGKGIGVGDIYLGILLGFIFPDYLLLTLAIVISYFIGAISGLFLIAINKKKLSGVLPLGLFLSLGGMLTIFFGSQILSWYLGLL
ncbi:MAG: prepilin peptidase [Candidatus Falkowbacteria bacterium]|nr:prepilin peptidase [Candidatus Falkowbacteria bacterium]